MHRSTGAFLTIGSLMLMCTLLAAGADGQAPAKPSAGQPAQPAQAAAAPLDVAIGFMHEAKRNYTAVKDYTCTLMTKENIKGELKEESIIQMKFRPQPFSVYMRWLSPTAQRGQEVAYIHGKNGNKMRVQSKGILKIAGFVSIDVNDPRVLEHSRHTILEAGIGHLIDTTIKTWTAEKRIGRTDCKIAEYDYNNRRCYRIENTRAERRPEYYCHRSVIYLEKDSKLPMRHECYNWPRPGGPPQGELMEMYSFVDLRFNVGLTDRDFDK
jgi:hypothetical protein